LLPIAALTLVLILLGVLERALHERSVRRVPLRILVNGTRGKTSVTRLLSAALREAGYATYAKCTGTSAAWILPEGTERPLLRRGGPRLTEQIPFMKSAAGAGAEAVVVECMAIRPDSQRAMALLTRPTMVLITNARVDHVGEIGHTREETLRALACSVPPGAVLVSPEADFRQYGFDPVNPAGEELEPEDLEGFRFPVFAENLRLVLAACRLLGVERGVALRGMRRALPDLGMAGPFNVGDCVVVNAFAANDAVSSAALLKQTEREPGLAGSPLYVVFNNRADREYRLRAFAPLLRELSGRVRGLVAIGDHAAKAARFFHRHAGTPFFEGSAEDMLNLPGIVLCLGNAKGAGLDFLARCQAREGEA
jgi:poly-gamma-glutamate synthase PgsB/CapB